MKPKDFIEKYKDTDTIVSLSYKSGPYDCFLTAYPKGITNPHFVEFRATSFINWKRMSNLLDEQIQ